MMTQKIRISVGLTENEYSELEKRAAHLDVSISWLARKIIAERLNNYALDNRNLTEELSGNRLCDEE